jgi:hypothetical protein
MTEAIAAVGGAIIGAGALLLERILNRRYEERRWQRDRRLDAYIEFIDAFNQYYFEAGTLVAARLSPGWRSEEWFSIQQEKVLQLLQRFQLTRAKIIILQGGEVLKAAEKLHSLVAQMRDWALGIEEISSEDYKRKLRCCRQASDSLHNDSSARLWIGGLAGCSE